MSKLNTSQQVIADELLKKLEHFTKNYDTNNVTSLIGPAGVGKTFLTKYLIEHLLSKKIKVHASAPTHKAVRVLKNNLKSFGSRVTFTTIHAFLRLKLKPNYQLGIHELIQDNFQTSGNNIVATDILIIDESSMVSEQLYKYITIMITSKRVKGVLLIGDNIQLKPVDNSEMIIMNSDYELTEIVRQARDNSIIAESTFIRECIQKQNFVPLHELLTKETKEITLFDNHDEFINDYLNNKNDKIVASYTNGAVNSYNGEIRYRIHGDVPYIIPGDVLIFQEAYEENKMIVYANNDDIVVKEAELSVDFKTNINYWTITPEDGSQFNIVDKSSLKDWDNYLEYLKNKANSADASAKKVAWRYYFIERAKYAYTKYHYASTIHKLQGSTYEDIYFDFKSIINNTNNYDNLYRLVYVAITRASGNLKVLR